MPTGVNLLAVLTIAAYDESNYLLRHELLVLDREVQHARKQEARSIINTDALLARLTELRRENEAQRRDRDILAIRMSIIHDVSRAGVSGSVDAALREAEEVYDRSHARVESIPGEMIDSKN